MTGRSRVRICAGLREFAARTSPTFGGAERAQIRPRIVTICRLIEYDDRWKMLIARGKVVPSDDVLAGTSSWVEIARGRRSREVANHQKLYRTLVDEGFTHHASLVHGDQVKALLEACKFLDIQPVLVE